MFWESTVDNHDRVTANFTCFNPRFTRPLYTFCYTLIILGWFVYVETSFPRLNKDKARLVSPDVDRSNNCLEFYYHMYGDHVNRLNVYIRTGTSDVLVWTVSKNQGDAWKSAQVPLPSSAQRFQVICFAMTIWLLGITMRFSYIEVHA